MALVVGENTYNTLIEANDYFATRYNSGAWAALDDSVKETLLISSTRDLDLYCEWLYEKTDSEQVLEFPRNSETVIPEYIKQAQLEIAFSMLESGSVIETITSAVKKSKLDILEEENFDNIRKTSSLYSSRTKSLLSRYCCGSSGSKQLIRV